MYDGNLSIIGGAPTLQELQPQEEPLLQVPEQQFEQELVCNEVSKTRSRAGKLVKDNFRINSPASHVDGDVCCSFWCFF